ncbi:Protein N-acetyltransferase, RimJ/RimL family [Clostridium collagenovorans DSM 3089]|uniref:Protein N-acetyltransferase, RimJ/RimL family n=1 Tax=Clostridium collagenovorans DSM 3089 TaxID=1121306 RepID=A0A1M5UX77_9CLOT|nr:GNAT family protein [Clostridium collagenovorans]SHH67647.1 Protein N-acetyltransferase, RimJ/RimL family [Clostridium collagenovorans DSM 3089]
MDIKLRSLKNQDKTYFFSWLRDQDVIRYSLSIFQNMKTHEDISLWFDNILLDNSTYNKAIFDNSTGNLIGYAGICNLSKTNLSGEYFIFIGDKDYHNKGIGTYVTKEIIKYGFENLNLNRIMLTVSNENIGAVKAYTKANFKQEGVMRQASYRDGKFHDKIIMGILKDEWKNN